jgi:Leucine-rich repeat (LRR) protein
MKYIKTYEDSNGISFFDWLKTHHPDIKTTRIICDDSNLIDLNGVEKFTNLENLYCYNNKLTELPDLSNLTNLEILNCSYNKLTELPDLNNLTKLKKLHCHKNKLTELPDLSNLTNFIYLNCSGNDLPYRNLDEYLEWHKKTYPWIWDAKKYNI